MLDKLESVLNWMEGVSEVRRKRCDLWEAVECVFQVGEDSAPVAVHRYADGSLVVVTFYGKGYRQREVPADSEVWELCEALAVAAFRRCNPRQGVEVVYALEAV